MEQPEKWPHAGGMTRSLRVASVVSILGHPMLVMPMAAWLALRASGATTLAGLQAIAGIVLLGCIVLGYASIQVHRGRWRHVDASGDAERRSLNAFLLVLLVASAATAWLGQGPSPLILALGLSAAIILFALLMSPLCKVSLHVAFIAFAAFIPGTLAAGLCMATLGACVAWSRVKLGRHTPPDLVAGLLAGTVAGIVFLTSMV